MNRLLTGSLCASVLICLLAPHGSAQTSTSTGTAVLREIHSDGQRVLTEAQIATLTGLQSGAQVGRADLQNAADKLIASGLFSTVKYDFKTHAEGVSLNFHVSESPRVPVYYDNFPWLGDSELSDAIRTQLPFYDGTLPEDGYVVATAANAIQALLASHKLDLPVQHQVMANPLADGNIQQFFVQGATQRIASLTFSDASLAASPLVGQHLSEIVGKPYSRAAIDIFLAEQIRPIYSRQGHLKAKLGPPEVRLSGAPAQKPPEEIPVFVPVEAGPVYHFAGIQWSGNNILSSITLAGLFGMKAGGIADGMQVEAGLERVREEYGRRGYLEATAQPEPVFDDAAHTVIYKVAVIEGTQYHMGGWVITGLSSNGELRVRSTFPIAAGDVFDKIKYEDYLVALQNHSKDVLGDLPVHYENVGHWLKTDASKGTVDVLLDFK
jgi:outer membrane protein assembly factor BamA